MKNQSKQFIFLVFFFLLIANHDAVMAGKKPSDSPREKLNFNADWRFYRGNIPEDAALNPAFDDAPWTPVHLPHAPKMLPLRPDWKPDNEGINWYRKTFRLSEKNKGRKLFIEFEAADQVADVWVNGIHLTTHTGSFLPFTVDITDVVRFGKESNLIAVEVNNFENRDIPVYGGWISFGGLYRDVSLIKTDRLHITDPIFANQPASGGLFVTYPLITDSLAEIQIETHILNEYSAPKNCGIKTILIDADARPVASVETRQSISGGSDHLFNQRLSLTNFSLWHPDHPYLYTLRSEVYAGDQRVDVTETRIGIRRIAFSHDNGFTINGERLVFMGANRVQEYPYVAWAVPNSAQRRDAIRLKEAGFQYVRTSHNPQDPAFLDACDELGILVMDCIPGFQFIGGPQFRENSFETMREIIRRDRNHPSIILWELSLNETDYDSAFAQTAMRIGHEEFPGDQCFVAGWKFPEIYDVFLRATQHCARDYREETPLVISEYGHWDYGGGKSTSDVDRQAGEAAMLAQAHNHQESLNLNRALPFLCGDGLWVSMDFQRYPSGVTDYFRLPKFSHYFYQSQRDPNLKIDGIDSGPMVYIANFWAETSPHSVTVYSNCERVDFFLDGERIASQWPDTSALSTHLLHPPFVFENLAWRPGELKAVGYIDGREAASHTRITPGPAARLALSFEMDEVARADGEDLFFVYASVVDANGTVICDRNVEVSFLVEGPGYLACPDRIQTEAGIAAALVRTTTKAGKITVHAEAEGLGKTVAVKKCVRFE